MSWFRRSLPSFEGHSNVKNKNKRNWNKCIKLSNELLKNNKIYKVYHPALSSHKNHKIWKRDFSGSSGLFSFELDKKYSNNYLEKFFNKLKIFKIGYSWGGFESLITFPTINERKFKENIKGSLVRVYCGLEDNNDQIKDIIDALKFLK